MTVQARRRVLEWTPAVFYRPVKRIVFEHVYVEHSGFLRAPWGALGKEKRPILLIKWSRVLRTVHPRWHWKECSTSYEGRYQHVATAYKSTRSGKNASVVDILLVWELKVREHCEGWDGRERIDDTYEYTVRA